VERAHLVGGRAHHHDRRVGRVDLLGEVAADARELLDATDVEPGPREDGLALELGPRGDTPTISCLYQKEKTLLPLRRKG
jgi:hypothetical protein